MHRVACLAFAVVALSGCPSLWTVYGDRANIAVDSDVAYIDDGTSTHRLDLYSPIDAPADAPIVLFFHGGYWVGQDKQYFEFASGVYGNVGVALAREGIRVANCNYRFFPEVKLDGMLQDVDAAVAFVREAFPDAPIIIMGHSAGAHLASAAPMLPTGPHTRVDAMVLVSGIFDIVSAVETDSQENRDEILLPLFGETPAEQATASTIDQFTTSTIPTLIVAGTDDLPGIKRDFKRLREDFDDGAFDFVEVEGSDHAGTVISIGSDQDVTTPAVVSLLQGRGLLR